MSISPCRCPCTIHSPSSTESAAAGHVKVFWPSLDCQCDCHLTAGMSTNKSSCKNGILNRFWRLYREAVNEMKCTHGQNPIAVSISHFAYPLGQLKLLMLMLLQFLLQWQQLKQHFQYAFNSIDDDTCNCRSSTLPDAVRPAKIINQIELKASIAPLCQLFLLQLINDNDGGSETNLWRGNQRWTDFSRF